MTFRITSASPLLTSYIFSVERRSVTGPHANFERDIVVHPGAVAVVAVDPAGRVGVIRQYRASVDRFLHEIPAGTIDPGESDTLLVAQRELAEELGVHADQWELLGRFYNSPGWTNQVMTVYLASGLTSVGRTPVGPEEDAATVEWWSPLVAESWLANVDVVDFTTATGLRAFLNRYDRR